MDHAVDGVDQRFGRLVLALRIDHVKIGVAPFFRFDMKGIHHRAVHSILLYFSNFIGSKVQLVRGPTPLAIGDGTHSLEMDHSVAYHHPAYARILPDRQSVVVRHQELYGIWIGGVPRSGLRPRGLRGRLSGGHSPILCFSGIRRGGILGGLGPLQRGIDSNGLACCQIYLLFIVAITGKRQADHMQARG